MAFFPGRARKKRAKKGSEAWKYYHSDGSRQDEDPGEPLVQGIPEGVIALADGIKNNGTLAKLNIRNNDIPYDQQANLKDLCTSKRIALAL